MSTLSKPNTGALVLGGSYVAAGVARSLGRQRIPVWLVRSGTQTVAAHSRYVRGMLPWPADAGEHERVEHLLELAERHGLDGWTLLPGDDETAALLSRSRQRLRQRYLVAVCEWDVMRWAYDKRLTQQLAHDVGVDQPRSWLGGADFSAADVRFPAILKPAFKRERNRFTTAKAWPVADRAELERSYAIASTLVPPEEILLQELIPGGGECQMSFAALAHNGRPLASLTACRARQYPMDFGRESTFVFSVEDPAVEASALRLLEQLSYSGLVEIEFKRDARDGGLKLLDINPRVWGWHSLGARAGVDFIHLYWRHLHGEELAPTRARPGVRWMRASTDLPTCALELAAGRMGPRRYLGSLRRPLERAMFCLDDPLPGLLDMPLLVASMLRRRLRALRR